MLGNFLKIDYVVVSFSKPSNSACFSLEMIDLVANRLDRRPAAGLDPTCLHKHKCCSCTEKVKYVTFHQILIAISFVKACH